MASHRPSIVTGSKPQHARGSLLRRRGRLFGLGLSAALVGITVLGLPSAQASPRPTVSQVLKRVSALQDKAESATEDYNAAKDALKSSTVRLNASQGQLKQEQAQVAKARRVVGQLASETYRRGQLSTLELVLGDDPEDALAQAGYLPSIGDQQVAAMNQLQQNENQLLATRAVITAQQQKALATENKLKSSRGTVLKELAAANREVHKLRASQQVQLTHDEQSIDNAGLPAGADTTAWCDGRADLAPSSEAKTAIRFACAQIGDAYVWGAAGPSTWDCSGLTMGAYGAAGVTLPHHAADQVNDGTRVSFSDVQPGDLLFFNSPISHVAIALGNGLMIHAPHTGDVVRVASIYETPSAVARY